MSTWEIFLHLTSHNARRRRYRLLASTRILWGFLHGFPCWSFSRDWWRDGCAEYAAPACGRTDLGTFFLFVAVQVTQFSWDFCVIPHQRMMLSSQSCSSSSFLVYMVPVAYSYLYNGNHVRKKTVELLVHLDTQCFLIPPQILPWIFTCK